MTNNQRYENDDKNKKDYGNANYWSRQSAVEIGKGIRVSGRY